MKNHFPPVVNRCLANTAAAFTPKPVLQQVAPALTPPVRRQLKFRADYEEADFEERTNYLRNMLPGEPQYPTKNTR